MHVNNRAIKQMSHNKSILKNFEYVDDVKFINGNTDNALAMLKARRVPIDVWAPYDDRVSPPLPGEYGIWISTINLWEYIVKNDIDKLLVLEDDVILEEDAPKIIEQCLLELPPKWDFLSLYYFNDQNEVSKDSDIDKKYIHKSINQHSAAQAMVYSKAGAQKLLKLIKRKGMEYTNDCFIYEQGKVADVNGFSIIPTSRKILTHTFDEVQSIIDPDNYRHVALE